MRAASSDGALGSGDSWVTDLLSPGCQERAVLVSRPCPPTSSFPSFSSNRALGVVWKFLSCPSSVQFSRSVVSDSLWPHESQHARPPCPSPTPGVHSDSRPSSQWCHPATSFSVVPFSSCSQSLPASESFQWVNSSRQVVKVLEFQLQHHSFQRNPRADLLQNGLVAPGPQNYRQLPKLAISFMPLLWILPTVWNALPCSVNSNSPYKTQRQYDLFYKDFFEHLLPIPKALCPWSHHRPDLTVL